MQGNSIRETPSSQIDAWTWIMLVVLLVLGSLIGLGLMTIAGMNQAAQQATTTQAPPAAR